ncbi:phage tail tube protein [Filifactor alocis]|uniref:phage tail tube protein n=2 Tax=Filifactor alocis TaxID=143361 RepID=UPI0028E337FD|nr:hypothetical protein [Filifactor alocis]
MGKKKREVETMPGEIGKIIKRSDKVLFIDVKGTYKRLTGMTQASTSKNTKEYTRQYVDEAFERTDVVGMTTSIDFNLDAYKDNDAQKVIIDIINEEKVGTDAVVKFLLIDFTTGDESTGFAAVERSFAVVPNTEGGSLDAYTYEGTLKANGAPVKGKAKSTDKWVTATFEV